MSKRVSILLLSFFLVLNFSLFSQTDTSNIENANPKTSEQNSPKTESTGFVFKPTIGLGTGMFSYYGDVYEKHFQAPMVSRIAYELFVSQPFNDYLNFNFYVLFGKLGANERNTSNGRNVNFQSEIRAGGVNLQYNFGNFLPAKRTASPYITLGIESFEFLSKTDLFDKNGNRYYYWSDGTIRNIDQNAPNASTAIELKRDYTYESDIRETNPDGFGKYPERSFAIPVGAGAQFKINDYWDFRIGATMHFTFTDYIDGISNKSIGNRVGNSKNDHFMMSSFSLHYNLGTKKRNPKQPDEKGNFEDVDFYALDVEDMDKDGIVDSKDDCPGTPPGVPVDEKGCPLDDDADGVPNYMDDELNTPAGMLVDIKGVQLNDSTLAYQYALYVDSTGAFNKVEYSSHNAAAFKNYSQKEYMVELGTFRRGLPAELMTKYLSINDISSTNIDDSTTIYTAGKFNNLLDAENRKKQLHDDGLTNAKVVYKQNGKYYDAPKYGTNVASTSASNTSATNTTNTSTSSNNTNSTSSTNNSSNTTTNNSTNTNSSNSNSSNSNTSSTTNTNSNNNNSNSNNNSSVNNTITSQSGLVLRVQLGAYKNRLSKAVFRDVPNLIEIKTEDGLYKYMTGSFTNFDEAAKHKVEMLLKGYQGAFITAYKDGKRVPLQDAGATIMRKEDLQPEIDDNKSVNAVNTKLITFKIQVGVFKNEPPAEKQAAYDKLKGVSKETTSSGLNRYVVGAYNDFKAAQEAKNNIIKSGIEDAFIIAFFNGEYIPIQEALELMK